MGKSNEKVNITSGHVAIQVGRIVPASEEPTKDTKDTASKTSGKVTNVRSGNAKVGVQADVIEGDIRL